MIIIVSPYRHGDRTYAALRVAEAAAACGLPVLILSTSKCRRGVSSYWDNHVASAKKAYNLIKPHGFLTGFGEDCTVVWFRFDPVLFSSINIYARGVRHYWVVDSEEMSPPWLEYASKMKGIVTPSRYCRRLAMSMAERDNINVPDVSHLFWAVPCPRLNCRDRYSPAQSVYWYAENTSLSIPQCANRLLEENEGISLRIETAKSQSRRDRKALLELRTKWGERLELLGRLSEEDRIRAISSSDWVLCDHSGSFAVIPLLAWSCGVPFIAPRSQIIGEISSSCLNGFSDTIYDKRVVGDFFAVCRNAFREGGMGEYVRNIVDSSRPSTTFHKFWENCWTTPF